jgi:hypothetical protein
MLRANKIFRPVHGTSIAMLGIDCGVLVAAHRNQGYTLSSAKALEDVSKILPIGANGLVTGWGMAALRAEDDDEIRVDMFNIFKAASLGPDFGFNRKGYQIVGQEWTEQMRDHLKRCSRDEWPPTPACGYWFKSLWVHATGSAIKADLATFLYENRTPEPLLTGRWECVMDEFVRGGSLFVEGDSSGMNRIEIGSAEFAFLPETRAAWRHRIDPSKIDIALGARILKDALYANHLYCEVHNGKKGVGTTCDIAFIDESGGFQWHEQEVLSAPEQRN